MRQNEIKPSGCEIFLFKLHIMSKNNVLHSFCLSGFSQKRGRFKDLVTICNSNRYYQLQRKESLFLSMLAGFHGSFSGAGSAFRFGELFPNLKRMLEVACSDICEMADISDTSDCL